MSFQIHDASGKAVDIKQLDKEAAEFWGVEVHPKNYAQPASDSYYTSNWFDSIGYYIHSPDSNYTKGWGNIKCSLWSIQARDLFRILYETQDIAANEHLHTRLHSIKTFLQPYFQLIDHWESKGYIPVRVKED